jgi:hypothetical protein
MMGEESSGFATSTQGQLKMWGRNTENEVVATSLPAGTGF